MKCIQTVWLALIAKRAVCRHRQWAACSHQVMNALLLAHGGEDAA